MIERDREIDESVLAEQDLPDHRQIGQDRQMELRRRHDLVADKARADQSRKADAENRQRKAGRDLVDRKAEREDGENRRQCRARDDAAERADQRRARQIGAGEAAGRAHDHHSFDAEIEHAGTLDNQFAGRRQQQRRRGRDHRQDEADGEYQFEDLNEGIKHGRHRLSRRCARGGCDRRSANCRRARRTTGCPGTPW